MHMCENKCETNRVLAFGMCENRGEQPPTSPPSAARNPVILSPRSPGQVLLSDFAVDPQSSTLNNQPSGHCMPHHRIQDEFNDPPISRQGKYQLRK